MYEPGKVFDMWDEWYFAESEYGTIPGWLSLYYERQGWSECIIAPRPSVQKRVLPKWWPTRNRLTVEEFSRLYDTAGCDLRAINLNGLTPGDLDWVIREYQRDTKGSPVLDDWAGYPYFLHLSEASPGKVAYTPSSEYGKADRQVVTRFGRFLSKMTDLSANEIEHTVTMFNLQVHGQCKLDIAKTADEIEWVYENGPSSCMVRKGFEIHPCRAYASGDIGVAWIGSNEAVMARCVVNLKDMRSHYHIYSDNDTAADVLSNLMESAGFEDDGCALGGCKLVTIKHNGRLIGPYIDGDVPRVKLYKDDLLVISDDGTYVGSTNGCLESEGVDCTSCGELYDEDDLSYTTAGYVCHNCLETYFVWSEYEGEYIPASDATCCDKCGEYFPDSAMLSHGRDELCEGCYEVAVEEEEEEELEEVQ